MDFLQSLGKKISKTYDAASEKTEKVTRHAKLKINISDYKDKIREQYSKIGEAVYLKYIDHREDEIALNFIEEFKTIDNYKDKIKDAENEILELKELKKCLKCGAQFEEKFDYCPKCGTKHGETENTENNNVKKEEEE